MPHPASGPERDTLAPGGPFPIECLYEDMPATPSTDLLQGTLDVLILKVLTTRNPKVRYAILSGRLMNWTIPQLLPKRFLDRTIGKAVGLLPS